MASQRRPNTVYLIWDPKADGDKVVACFWGPDRHITALGQAKRQLQEIRDKESNEHGRRSKAVIIEYNLNWIRED